MKKSYKLLIGIPLGIIVLLVLGGFVASMVVSPNQYKGLAESKFQEATGYKLTINGDIGLSLFPVPKAYVESISIANGPKQLAEIDQINIYPKLLSLFGSNKEISSVTVKSPVISLEKTPVGNNWTLVNKPEKKEGSGNATIKIGDINIKGGEVVYKDTESNKSYKLDEVDFTTKLDLAGKNADVEGLANFNELPVNFKAGIKNFSSPELDVLVKTEESSVIFKGLLSGGKLVVSSKDLAPLLKAAGTKADMLAGKPVSLDGNFGYHDKLLEIPEATVLIGSTTGKVSAAAQFDEVISSRINLDMDKLVVEDFISKTPKDPNEPDKPFPKLNAEINANVKNFVYKNVNYSDFKLSAMVDKGNISIKPISFSFPGGGSFELYGVLSKGTKVTNFSGNVVSSTGALKEVLKGFGVNTANLAAGGLNSLDLAADLSARIDNNINVNFANMQLELDKTTASGSMNFVSSKPAKIDFNGRIGKINLANYTKPKAPLTKEQQIVAKESNLDFSWLNKLPVELGVNTSIDELTVNGKSYSNLKIVGSAKPGEIKLSQLSGVINNIGIGAVVNFNSKGPRPVFFLDANMDNVDLAALSTKAPAGAGTTPTTPGPQQWSEKTFNFSPLDKFDGEVRANVANIKGNKIAFTNAKLKGRLNNGKAFIDDFTSTVYGGSINLKGELGMGSMPNINVTFAANNVDLNQFLTNMADNKSVTGRASINGNFSASGVNQKSMINNLSGNSAISATDIYVKGFDVDSFATQATDINNIFGVVSLARIVANPNATTNIVTVQGKIDTERGVMKTNGIDLATRSGAGTFAGQVDLPKWTMDTNARFKLIMPDQKTRPTLGIMIFGPLNALKTEYDTKEVEQYVADRISKGLVKNNVISEKYQDVLKPGGVQNVINQKLMDKLGIKQPAQQQPATNAPAADGASDAGTAPATAPAAPAPTPQQQLLNEGFKQLFGN